MSVAPANPLKIIASHWDVVVSGNLHQMALLLEQLRPCLRSSAQRFMPDLLTPKVDPSDLVQDTSARVVEKMSRFRGDCPAEFWAWLNAVIRSEADRLIKQYSTAKRTVAREQSLDELADLSDRHRPSETSVEEEDLRQFRISVYQRLKPDLQETIRLRLFENLSFRDMAIRLNREKDSVKKLYDRAIAVWKLACDRELALRDGPGGPGEPE